ncbi:MAG: hypothetical protein HYW22_01140 [Candidatus Aenigmarchaeota archaeon]|nr:hypothetical protein [Candidatus Aenigmarchaeota archaeon]
MKGISTIIATILMLMITIALAGAAYVFVNNAVLSKERFISLIDSFCSGGSLTATVKNEGPDTLKATEQIRISVDEACQTDFTPTDIPSGSSAIYTSTGCTTGRAHSYRLVGSANAIEIRASCA